MKKIYALFLFLSIFRTQAGASAGSFYTQKLPFLIQAITKGDACCSDEDYENVTQEIATDLNALIASEGTPLDHALINIYTYDPFSCISLFRSIEDKIVIAQTLISAGANKNLPSRHLKFKCTTIPTAHYIA